MDIRGRPRSIPLTRQSTRMAVDAGRNTSPGRSYPVGVLPRAQPPPNNAAGFNITTPPRKDPANGRRCARPVISQDTRNQMDDSWNGRNMPGSGAYAVRIDQDITGGWPGVAGVKTGVVPLPPTNSTGTIKFNPVFLSLANSGSTAVTVNVTIFRQGAGSTTSPFTVPPGTRVSVPGSSPAAPGDLAVGITTTAALPAAHVLTALVEYGTP